MTHFLPQTGASTLSTEGLSNCDCDTYVSAGLWVNRVPLLHCWMADETIISDSHDKVLKMQLRPFSHGLKMITG